MKVKLIIMMMSVMLVLTSCIKITVEFPGSDSESDTAEVAEEAIEENAEEKIPTTAEQKKIAEPVFEEVDILPSMSRDERREVNIFLSNFSEAYYGTGEFPESIEDKISFAYNHALINTPDLAFYEDSYMGIKASDLDSILIRFFGNTIPHKTPEEGFYWIYRDGKFLMPAASGEFYGYFTVATSVIKKQDGLFEVSFNVYADYSSDGVISDNSVYYIDEASADAAYELAYCGNAVLKSKVYNGKNTYELISYTIPD